MEETRALTETLQTLEDETKGSVLLLGDVVKAFNHRGFGSLLLIPALLTILPTGAIPGFPILGALFICLITGQIIAGRRHPWLPEKIKNLSLKRKKIISVISRIKPYTEKLDRYIRPRILILSNKLIHSISAVICFFLATLIVFTGFIPFMPALLSFPILLFALGITTKDGVMTLCGFSFAGATIFLILFLSGIIGGEGKIHAGHSQEVENPSFFIELEVWPN